MAYVNPGDTLLRKHGAGSNQYYERIANPPVHPATMRAEMPRYYLLPDQRLIERVPRPIKFSPPWDSTRPVTFSTNGFPGGRLKNIWKGTVTVDAPNDPVFEKMGFRSTVINLEWPGYGHVHSARIDVLPDGKPLTRQQLAREICGLLIGFHKSISQRLIAPGWEKWALTAGQEGIRVSDVVLFSLHYYLDVWVPEFYVIE